jgi:hypothetical protein
MPAHLAAACGDILTPVILISYAKGEALAVHRMSDNTLAVDQVPQQRKNSNSSATTNPT